MNSLRPAFEQRGLDLIQWQQHMHRHPQEYIRRKLRAIRAYAQGQSVQTLAQQLTIHPNTLRHYITTYCLGGFESLCQPEKRKQPKRLTPQQEAEFKQVLLKQRPADHGLPGNIWTGQLMCQYLKATYQVDYHSGIYDLLERLNLSHQKAHADYENADPVKQQAFLNEFKESLLTIDNTHTVVVYDEFSVAEKPTSFYGWAEKNTRPQHVTDEKKVSV